MWATRFQTQHVIRISTPIGWLNCSVRSRNKTQDTSPGQGTVLSPHRQHQTRNHHQNQRRTTDDIAYVALPSRRVVVEAQVLKDNSSNKSRARIDTAVETSSGLPTPDSARPAIIAPVAVRPGANNSDRWFKDSFVT